MHMRFHYKKPGEWLWKLHTTDTLAAEVDGGWFTDADCFRLENTAEDLTLNELLRLQSKAAEEYQPRLHSRSEPDGEWKGQFVSGFFTGAGVCFVGSLYAESWALWETLVVSLIFGLIAGVIGMFCSKRGFEFLLRILTFPN